MKDKCLVRKSKEVRKILGFVDAIKLCKLLYKGREEKALNFLHLKGFSIDNKVTSFCLDDGYPIGHYTITKNDKKFYIPYTCCGVELPTLIEKY